MITFLSQAISLIITNYSDYDNDRNTATTTNDNK